MFELTAEQLEQCLQAIKWDDSGLVPAIAQDNESGQILMMAWMNKQALSQTIEQGQVVYWSRSRDKLWHKGEESGHFQTVHDIQVDCDQDVLVIKVTQHGGIACHTGRAHCFFRKLGQQGWVETDPVLKDPKDIY